MLINCAECGKQFSDQARCCPNCACPTSISTSGNTSTSQSVTYQKQSTPINKNGCPKCYSGNVTRQVVVESEVTKGRTENVKKSKFERSVNKSARKGMNFITGGLWGIFTSPKSEYKEKSKYTTSNIHCIYCNCMNCGYQWKE